MSIFETHATKLLVPLDKDSNPILSDGKYLVREFKGAQRHRDIKYSEITFPIVDFLIPEQYKKFMYENSQ